MFLETPWSDLQAAGEVGDQRAILEQARRLLIGWSAPQEPPRAIELLRQLERQSDPEAISLLATLYAAGAWVVQDWAQALDLLERAAALGEKRAQEQLALLSQPTCQGDSGDWGWLRRGIRLEDWRRPATRDVISESPRIRRVQQFVSPAICRWLVGCGDGRFKQALMFDGRTARFSAERNNSDFVFDMLTADMVILLVRERISATLRLPIFSMEPPQIFHYATGQEIRPHYDHIRAENGCQAERIATFLLYLNDDYEGGELEFVSLGLRHRGRCGDGIYFANVDAQGQPDMQTLHAALPVTRGEKWVLSQWVQDRNFGS